MFVYFSFLICRPPAWIIQSASIQVGSWSWFPVDLYVSVSISHSHLLPFRSFCRLWFASPSPAAYWSSEQPKRFWRILLSSSKSQVSSGRCRIRLAPRNRHPVRK
ncbi:unnamed protein product [Musa banksii]